MTRVPLLATPMSHGGNSVELTVLTFRHYCVPWTQWSAPIKIEDIGFIHLRVRLPDDDMDVVKADVVIDGSTIFVILSAAENDSSLLRTTAISLSP